MEFHKARTILFKRFDLKEELISTTVNSFFDKCMLGFLVIF